MRNDYLYLQNRRQRGEFPVLVQFDVELELVARTEFDGISMEIMAPPSCHNRQFH